MRSRPDEVLDDDDNTVVPDGGRVRVPAYLMDNRRCAFAFDADDHRPHHAELSDEVRKLRATTRAEYVGGLQDAWRSPRNLPAVGKSLDSGGSNTPDADDDPVRRRSAAYDEMVRNLGRAWQRPLDQAPADDHANQVSRDARSNAASAMQRELENWQGRDLSELASAVEARRRAVHAEFSQRLSNAWRLSHY